MSRKTSLHTSARYLAAALLLLPIAVPFACSPVERDFGGGTGGGGTTGPCEPNTTAACYSGPEGTEDVGICAAGTQVCNADGNGFGACEGEVLPSQEDCTTPEDEDCDGLTPPCPLTTLWARGFPSGDLGAPPRIAVDPMGNVIVGSSFSGQLDLGDGQVLTADSTDAYVLKLASDGALVWVKQYGGPGRQYIQGLGVDAQGGIHIAGTFDTQIDLGEGSIPSVQNSDDIFVARLSPAGDLAWSDIFGGPQYENVTSLAVDASGRPVVTGSFSGTVSFGNQTLTSVDFDDIFVVKLAAQGSPTVFARSFSSNQGNEYARGLAVYSSGNTLLTGYFSNSIDFGSGVITSAGDDDVFLTELNASGVGVSAARYGEAQEDLGFDVTVDSMDGTILTGSYQGIVDFGGAPLPAQGAGTNMFLVSFAPDGSHRWSMRFGENEVAGNLSTVAVDGQDNTLVAGFFSSELRFGDTVLQVGMPGQELDGFIAKIDSAGQPVAARSFGTSNLEGAFDVAVDASGAVYFVGVTLGTGLDFGTGELPPPGPEVTNFVVKLAP